MSIDIRKLSAQDLKKLTDQARRASGAGSLRSIEQARKDLQGLAKDSETLKNVARKNPGI